MGQTPYMDIRPGKLDISPALRTGWQYGPTHDYHVAFWRQPKIPAESLPEGVTQERVLWPAAEYDIQGASDAIEVMEWASAEAHRTHSIFTLWVVIEYSGRQGMIWLAGWDPTRRSSDNPEKQRPSDVDPVNGTPAEVYGNDADGPAFVA